MQFPTVLHNFLYGNTVPYLAIQFPAARNTYSLSPVLVFVTVIGIAPAVGARIETTIKVLKLFSTTCPNGGLKYMVQQIYLEVIVLDTRLCFFSCTKSFVKVLHDLLRN